MLTLFTVLGIMAGIFLYEYTDYFSVLSEERLDTAASELNLSDLLSLCSSELKLLGLIFVSGFTLFSFYIVALSLIYKGFMTGFSTLYFGLQYRVGALDTRTFILVSIALITSVMVYLIMGAKAMAFGSTLKYAAPDIAFIFRQRVTKSYIMTFLLMTAFIVIITALKYAAPYI